MSERSDSLGKAAHLWWTETDAPRHRERRGEYLALLSPEERERWEGIRVERGRDEFLVGRALLRTTLSRYADREPRAWRFVLGERGRPELADASHDPSLAALRFNLAHSEGLVVCLIAVGGDAGVDVEHPRRAVDRAALAARFFAEAERGYCDTAPEHQRSDAFFTVWTLKEAYLKARGVGIGLPLRSLSLAPDGAGRIRAGFGPEVGDDPERWQFDLFRAPTGHLIATALSREANGPRPIVAHPPEGASGVAPPLEALAATHGDVV